MESNHKEFPCRACTRVRDPAKCENKLCKEWQAWFIERWEAMRTSIMQQAAAPGVQGDTISVGGTEYHHPNHVRQFLEIDPCVQCPWSDGLCMSPCEARQVWLESKERINELESGS